MTNTPASVKTRLYNLSKVEGVDFQLLLLRFLHERFLYRLSVSEYADRFLLKGGALLYSLQGLKARPTKDLDFLEIGASPSSDRLSVILKSICAIEVNDATRFILAPKPPENIKTEDKYSGIRVFIEASVHTAQQLLHIDVGYGDVVKPAPLRITYPTLLKSMEPPKLMVYTVESMVAEKFHAMVELAEVNSRMKDFFDVFTLFSNNKVNRSELFMAVSETFKRRNTNLRSNPVIFTSTFWYDPRRIAMWKAFLKRINYAPPLSFNEVMLLITHELEPVYNTLLKKNTSLENL